MPTDVQQSSARGNTIATRPDADLAPTHISRSKAFERSWPYLLGAAVAIGYGIWGGLLPLSLNLKDFLIAVVGFAGAGAGFMLAAASILVTVSNSWYMARAKESGVYTSLVQYLVTAVGWSFAIAILSLVGILYEPARDRSWTHLALTGWTLCAVTALGAIIRVLRLFTLLLKFIGNE